MRTSLRQRPGCADPRDICRPRSRLTPRAPPQLPGRCHPPRSGCRLSPRAQTLGPRLRAPRQLPRVSAHDRAQPGPELGGIRGPWHPSVAGFLTFDLHLPAPGPSYSELGLILSTPILGSNPLYSRIFTDVPYTFARPKRLAQCQAHSWCSIIPQPKGLAHNRCSAPLSLTHRYQTQKARNTRPPPPQGSVPSILQALKPSLPKQSLTPRRSSINALSLRLSPWSFPKSLRSRSTLVASPSPAQLQPSGEAWATVLKRDTSPEKERRRSWRSGGSLQSVPALGRGRASQKPGGEGSREMSAGRGGIENRYWRRDTYEESSLECW